MTFHELHHRDAPLVLPNAWDVPSALAFVDAGFEAIGTTSFGVASGLGRPDGARASKDANLALARQLARLPAFISVDVEDGYADNPRDVAAYIARLDVAGINIEDSTAERLIAPQAHAAKIAAVKELSPDLFVNARVDTYWLNQDAGLEATLHRANAYVEAGADGIFVPGASDPAVLRELTANIPVPLNVLVIPDLTVADLGRLGVRRISTGSLPYRAAIHAATHAATAVRDGNPDLPAATPYPDLQRRLTDYDRTPH
ncbi:2-Methylisocitrate lyase, PEP mutase family [Streptomyces sp. DvalAA-14]|uniref:isocitrate lyase/PEP mutase family protein n=1 Tax=unclassified Streptomyces TaxID=2593676 RepID=UPI00081AF4FF|nr:MULTISPECIES: isocitrate lyase/phosphoenolpyruvate mutase family protein [unclassified Streptomyces]MYS23783.1 isocitrate lyase/phosphoenolpyruvate mutase family protein [Streptomyces sp. SID4948]SCE38661.1 2-Methylisocitrate lyase, PEP mutase family [Streptomyces sp. DvalAA-14]